MHVEVCTLHFSDYDSFKPIRQEVYQELEEHHVVVATGVVDFPRAWRLIRLPRVVSRTAKSAARVEDFLDGLRKAGLQIDG